MNRREGSRAQQTTALVLTAALMAGVLWWTITRSGSQEVPPGATTGEESQPPGRQAVRRPQTGESLEACIGRLYDAAAAGDVQQYLQCFSRKQQQALRAQIQQQDEQTFARSLMETIGPLKGWAVVNPPQLPPEARGPVELTVERIFAHRMERQKYVLVKEGGRWVIERVEDPMPFQPPEKYGTPVWRPPAETP